MHQVFMAVVLLSCMVSCKGKGDALLAPGGWHTFGRLWLYRFKPN